MIQPALQTARILIVDDEQANARLLERVLLGAGYSEIRSVTDPRQSVDAVLDHKPDLVLLDLNMPHVDGFEVMDRIAALPGPDEYLPILILTADPTEPTKERALASGAKDFLTKPFRISETLLRVRNLLETRFLYKALLRQNDTLEEQVGVRTLELAESRLEVLERLARAAEFRDDDTGQHTRRVGDVSAQLARALGRSEWEVALVHRVAPLHDLGKVGIPDVILLKPGRLSPEEFEIMKTHTTIGADILSGGRSELMRMAADIALAHHERWDGNGYPHGIAGEEIPICARIVAVADVFDALSSDRPYRKAWSPDDVLGVPADGLEKLVAVVLEVVPDVADDVLVVARLAPAVHVIHNPPPLLEVPVDHPVDKLLDPLVYQPFGIGDDLVLEALLD
ncbi:MAG: response regulator, partial [Gemmatimonadetes bacterium]|nr:response regulator [Gemmatimonadota bacterium]